MTIPDGTAGEGLEVEDDLSDQNVEEEVIAGLEPVPELASGDAKSEEAVPAALEFEERVRFKIDEASSPDTSNKLQVPERQAPPIRPSASPRPPVPTAAARRIRNTSGGSSSVGGSAQKIEASGAATSGGITAAFSHFTFRFQ